MPDQAVKFKTARRVCRDRKVKCDKILPCRNCTLADTVCSFPPQVRTVRRPKRSCPKPPGPTDPNLLDRLSRLEELLRKHAPHLEEDDLLADSHPHGRRGDGIDETVRLSGHAHLGNAPHNPLSTGHPTASMMDEGQSEWSPSSNAPSPLIDPDLPDSGDGNDARYWKRLEQECAGHVFFNTTQPPDPLIKPSSPTMQQGDLAAAATARPPEPGFPFPHTVGGMPPPLLSLAHRRICWARYVESVDPLLKILHKPTVEGLITVRDVYHYNSHPSTGALLQAICLLAVISMSDSDVSERLGFERDQLLRLCAARAEQALMTANFLDARDLTTMQALLLYLYYLKHKEDPKLYALRGLTIFLAARLGLNRDRAPSGSNRLDVELRRRLWWQLITLVDHPDDCEIDYAPPSVGSDTRLPLNVNDSELEQPQAGADRNERRGFTESSFCLTQYEITRLFNRIRFERVHASELPRTMLDRAEERLHSSRQRMESQYFQDSTEPSPLRKFAADAMAMILTKRRVLMHISPGLCAKNSPLSRPDHDHLFLLSIHVLELSRALQTARNFEKWRWLSGTYFPWSVANFVARDLAVRSASPATKRGWNVISGILDNWPEPTRNSPKAAALKGLIADAALARDQQHIWKLAMPSLLDRHDRMPVPAGPVPPVPPAEEKRRDSPLSWSTYAKYPSLSQSLNLDDFLMPKTSMFDSNFALDFEMM